MSETISVTVGLAAGAYEVKIGRGLLASSGAAIREIFPTHSRCVLVTDSNVAPLYADQVRNALRSAGFGPDLLVVPAGESAKSMEQSEKICREMIRLGHDRSSFVIALGGGVIGDLAGFCAAIFFRGIPVVQIPTTIVSQVDSSVGGKTGVNTPEGKNLLGTFHQARLVLIDTETLKSLPQREFNQGMAEVIKHAAIRDPSLLDVLPEPGECSRLAPLIARNVEIKARIVEEDEKETTGTRALLNFGHTIGHGIEAAAGYGRFFHGEAIALGLRAACRISEKRSTLEAPATAAVESALDRFALPATLPDEVTTDSILTALRHDKKFRAGEISFVLLRKLGDAFLCPSVTMEEIKTEIENLRFS